MVRLDTPTPIGLESENWAPGEGHLGNKYQRPQEENISLRKLSRNYALFLPKYIQS